MVVKEDFPWLLHFPCHLHVLNVGINACASMLALTFVEYLQNVISFTKKTYFISNFHMQGSSILKTLGKP